MKRVLLEIKGLHVTYRNNGREVEALRGIDMSLETGAVTAVIGASGAGKSSLALALVGLHDPGMVQVSGEILFRGSDLVGAPESQLDRLRGEAIGMIFQDPRGSLDPTMKVEKQVAEALRLHREIGRDEAIAGARKRLEQVGVSMEIVDRSPYAHQLSSGLCQRVMIAIALAGDPVLLVADEPTGSLDLTRQAQILALLRQQVQERDLGMVLITHDLGVAAVVADQVIVLHEGRAVEHGPCKDVLASPHHDYTAAMIDAWREGFRSEDEIAPS